MSLKDLMRVPSWMDESACQGLDINLFFIPDNSRRDEKSLPGIQICQSCPVKQECLDYALKHRLRAGIFGGRTAQQRKRMRRRHLVSL